MPRKKTTTRRGNGEGSIYQRKDGLWISQIVVGLKPNGKRQTVQGAAVFPKAYFNPYEDATGRLYITDCTYAVHWYAKSWMNRRTVLRSKLTRPLHRLLADHPRIKEKVKGGV